MKIEINNDLIDKLKEKGNNSKKFTPKHSNEDKIRAYILRNDHKMSFTQIASYIKKEFNKTLSSGNIHYLVEAGKKLYENRDEKIDIIQKKNHQGNSIKSPRKNAFLNNQEPEKSTSKKTQKRVVKNSPKKKEKEEVPLSENRVFDEIKPTPKKEVMVKKTTTSRSKNKTSSVAEVKATSIIDKKHLAILDAELLDEDEDQEIVTKKEVDNENIIEPEIIGVGQDENTKEKEANKKKIEEERYQKLKKILETDGSDNVSDEDMTFFAFYLEAMNPFNTIKEENEKREIAQKRKKEG